MVVRFELWRFKPYPSGNPRSINESPGPHRLGLFAVRRFARDRGAAGSRGDTAGPYLGLSGPYLPLRLGQV